MTRTLLATATLLTLSLLGCNNATSGPAATQPSASLNKPLFPTRNWNDYKVISSRNIFSRYREPEPRPVETRPYEEPKHVDPDPASFWVLTGIVLDADSSIAFLEDTRTGNTEQIKPGQTLDNGKTGKITKIGLNYVEFAYKGGSRQVVLGNQLDGSTPGGMSSSGNSSIFSSGATSSTTPSTTPSTTSSSSSPTPTASNPPPTGGSDSDIIARMKARRAKETGGK